MFYNKQDFISGTGVTLFETNGISSNEEIRLPLRQNWKSYCQKRPVQYYALRDHMVYNYFTAPENSDLLDFMKSQSKGEILVDLGCGKEVSDNMLGLAKLCGFDLYVGVDLKQSQQFPKKYEQEKDLGIKVIKLQGDLFELVNCLKDNSVICSANGMDDDLLPDREDLRWLSEQITRVTKRQKIFFGFGWVDRFLRDKPEWEYIECENQSCGWFYSLLRRD